MFKPVILIPVYNHADTIAQVLAAVLPLGLSCILVNDGSNEACQTVLRQQQKAHANRVYLYEHAFNQGKGAALSTGLRAAQHLGFTHALQIDADGQHHLADASFFLCKSQENPDALICGYPVYDDSVPKPSVIRPLLNSCVGMDQYFVSAHQGYHVRFSSLPITATVNLINNQHIFSRMSFDIEILVRADWGGHTHHQLSHPGALPGTRCFTFFSS